MSNQWLAEVTPYGWLHENWVGEEGFYPEEMPEAWRLDFFANTFRSVCVPMTQWLSWAADLDETLDDLLESVVLEEDEAAFEKGDDVHLPFQFYFAVEKALTGSQATLLQAIQQRLGRYAAGVVDLTQARSLGDGVWQQGKEGEEWLFGIYPLEIEEGKAQAAWAETWLNRLKATLDIQQKRVPVIVGGERQQAHCQFKAPERVQVAESLKIVMEMLG